MLERSLQSILCILLIVSCLLIPFKKQDKYAEECFSDYPLLNFVIVLDAGHGGLTNTIN